MLLETFSKHQIFRTLDPFLYLTIPKQEVVSQSYDNWQKSDSTAHMAASSQVQTKYSALQDFLFPVI